MRINKYLSSCGLGSRRACDLLVESGRVRIDGKIAKAGDMVEGPEEGERKSAAGDVNFPVVTVDGMPVKPLAKKTYLRFYKPRGIVCTANPKEKDNIIEFLNYPVRLTYAGRLDKESEGLMLMTDDGDLIEKLMRAGDRHEKEYEVFVGKTLREDDLNEISKGVYLPELNRTTRPCRIEKINDTKFRIVLTEGMNREIRRMCALFGYPVRGIKRVRINNLLLGKLRPGKYEKLTEEELLVLRKNL